MRQILENFQNVQVIAWDGKPDTSGIDCIISLCVNMWRMLVCWDTCLFASFQSCRCWFSCSIFFFILFRVHCYNFVTGFHVYRLNYALRHKWASWVTYVISCSLFHVFGFMVSETFLRLSFRLSYFFLTPFASFHNSVVIGKTKSYKRGRNILKIFPFHRCWNCTRNLCSTFELSGVIAKEESHCIKSVNQSPVDC